MKNKDQSTEISVESIQKAVEFGMNKMISLVELTRTYALSAVKEYNAGTAKGRKAIASCDSIQEIKQVMLLDDWASKGALNKAKERLDGLVIGIASGGRIDEAREYRAKAIEHIDRLFKAREEEERLIQGAIQTEIEEQSTEELAKKQAWEKREEEKKVEFLRKVAEEAKKPPSKLEQANNTLSERLVREDTERLQSPSVRTFTCTENTFEYKAHLFAEAIITRKNTRPDTAIELQRPTDEIDTAHACMLQWMKKI